MRRPVRVLGSLLVAAGALTLIWVVIVWQWQDPFTAIYTHFQQERLAHAYAKRAEQYHPRRFHPISGASTATAAVRADVAREARAYGRSLQRGEAVGRIHISRIGLNMVLVQGTDDATLQKGPGHYIDSGLPGEGSLIYIAGHRTTYLAPFADIDKIRVGDAVTVEMPYGTFTYRVTRHYIVSADQLEVLRNHGTEILRLQACHPRFFATHRYIVDAKLVSIDPPAARSTSS